MSLLHPLPHGGQADREHARDHRERGPRSESWLGTALALAVAAVAIVAALNLPPPSWVTPTPAAPALPPVAAFTASIEPAGLGTSKIDWSRIEPAPEPSPMAVAAYDG